MNAVGCMKNLEGWGKNNEIPRNAFKKLQRLHLASSLQKVCAHMKLRDATIHSTQAHMHMLITEQWVKFHLDHSQNKEFVSKTAVIWQFHSYSARGLAHSTSTFFPFVQLAMRKFEQKLQY